MASLSTGTAAAADRKAKTNYNIDGSKKPEKKNRQRSSSSLPDYTSSPNRDHLSSKTPFLRSSSLSLSAQHIDNKLKAALEQSQVGALLPSQSTLNPPTQGENSLTSLMLERSDHGITWRWSRIRKGIRRRKLIGSRLRRSTDRYNKRPSIEGKSLQDHSSTEEDSKDMVDRVSRDNISTFSLNSVCLTSHNCQQNYRDARSCGEAQSHLSSSLSNKYQPKVFREISGHEMIVKALTNAVQKKKIAPLYLFHGASGTGKTSTARTFVMALNCESMSCAKPCWNCRGCSISLYTMELCSGSRNSGFEKIRTLLQNTTFTQIVSGFKVFIIEECHSLMEETWEEILSIAEKGYGSAVVFVLITENVNVLPRAVSSRCQKFCFSKLNDIDVTLKLVRIVEQESMRIEKDALKLIVSKADGSMREAENVLDQLVLLGPRITSSMVQQIVGLVPDSKLLELLTTVMSADTAKTMRSARELIASGVQPKSLLSQLASLVTDILSGPFAPNVMSLTTSSTEMRRSMNRPELTNNQYECLSHALKILVNTEKQISASNNDHTTWAVAALVQIASELISDRITTGSVLPIIPWDDKVNVESKRKTTRRNNKSRKSINKIGRVSLQQDTSTGPSETTQTIHKTNAIVHLTFKTREDKTAAQTSEETIADALKHALGCPVIVNMSTQPMQLEIIKGIDTISKTSKANGSHNSGQLQGLKEFPGASEQRCSSMRKSKSQKSHAVSENLKRLNLKEETLTQVSRSFTREGQERSDARSQLILPFLGPLMQVDEGDASSRRLNDPSTQLTSTNETKKQKHRWLSLSSIQQGDESVEPYSQDLLFENVSTNKERRRRETNSEVNKGPLKKDDENKDCQPSAISM
ncbi:hypothetical protein Scep_019699 [Stephania cephalantha]|uniref:Uncharacterized protein n=1 Tax=Stephania cephalantha TaxID=152367 RepID=A0AAP0NNK0_9MAGN